jgi:hypothetical protein
MSLKNAIGVRAVYRGPPRDKSRLKTSASEPYPGEALNSGGAYLVYKGGDCICHYEGRLCCKPVSDKILNF